MLKTSETDEAATKTRYPQLVNASPRKNRASLLERPQTRRGAFLICDEHLLLKKLAAPRN